VTAAVYLQQRVVERPQEVVVVEHVRLHLLRQPAGACAQGWCDENLLSKYYVS